MTPDLSTPVNISTKRTAVNVTAITLIVGAVCRIFGWELTLDPTDPVLLVVAPALGVIAGIGYRLSRAVTNKWPTAGWVLFGSGKEPLGVKKIAD